MINIDYDDLVHIQKYTKFQLLKNKKIFITGGTGFFGKWILESIHFANIELALNCYVTVLSRNPESFIIQYDYLNKNKYIQFIKGDIKNFNYPNINFDYIIHAATDASLTLNLENSLNIIDDIVEGTKHLLNFAKKSNVKKVLYISSGAVYGKQPISVNCISEDHIGAPNTLNYLSAYGEAKRYCELLCSIYSKKYNFDVSIARCFAFVGPHLPLDKHFAIGNFIRDSLLEQDIIINGDGTPYRSYLYAADLTIWIWTILIFGKTNCAYNVGSEQEISIKNLAELVKKISQKNIKIIIKNQINTNNSIDRYVPSIGFSKLDLGLKAYFSLEDSIVKTIQWNYRNKTISNI